MDALRRRARQSSAAARIGYAARPMTAEPRFPLLLLDVPPDEADEVGAMLFELGAEGVEQRDDTTLPRAAVAGLVTLVASFVDVGAADAALAELDAAWAPRRDELVGDAWRDAYKEHFHPFALTQRITVRPPWEAIDAPRDGVHVLVLEPGRAFGTGLHATTSLVAALLDAHSAAFAGKQVLDVGTGSGILALVALLLGAASARAVDVDADAVAVARENADRNDLADRLVADTSSLDALDAQYPVVVANIEARVLGPMARQLVARVEVGGLLVLSGVLVGQDEALLAAFDDCALLERPVEGEWLALLLERLR